MIVEHEKKMNDPHGLSDVVKLKAKLLHLETYWWLGVAPPSKKPKDFDDLYKG